MNFVSKAADGRESTFLSHIGKADDRELEALNAIMAKTAMAVATAYASEPVKGYVETNMGC